MKKSKQTKSDAVFTIAFFFLFIWGGWSLYREHFVFGGQEEEVAQKALSEKAHIIHDAARKVEIDARLLACIIYTELRLNVNQLDSYERVFASLGYNTSIGLAQIRIETARWIVDNVTDSLSLYSLDPRYHFWLPTYETRADIIALLENDSTNCLLAAFHLKQIMTRWQEAGFDIGHRPDIMATLYSYGLFRRDDGSEIVPHGHPRSNFFGKVAAGFFNSGKLRGDFP